MTQIRLLNGWPLVELGKNRVLLTNQTVLSRMSLAVDRKYQVEICSGTLTVFGIAVLPRTRFLEMNYSTVAGSLLLGFGYCYSLQKNSN